MANRFEKGLGAGASGAGLGMQVGGPLGAAIGGGLGALGGWLFGHGDKTPDLPEFQYSPGSLGSVNFADINLKEQNPELYGQLLKNNQILADMQGELSSRREGPTASENRQMHEYMNQQASALNSNGMAGSPVGNAMMADAAARLQDAQRERAFKEYQSLLGGVQNQAGNMFNMYSGAQGNIANLQNQAIQNAMHRDEFNRAQQMGQYGEAQKAAAAGNQFYGGLLNGGINMLGQANNMANYSNMMNNKPYNSNAAWGGMGDQWNRWFG